MLKKIDAAKPMPASGDSRTWTLRQLEEARYTLWVECWMCGHFASIGTSGIAARHGWHRPLADFAKHLVCEKCKARWPNVACHPAAKGVAFVDARIVRERED